MSEPQDEGNEIEIVELPIELQTSAGPIVGAVTLMTGHDLLAVLSIEIWAGVQGADNVQSDC